ncbi:Phosphate metabolism transcription protein [Elasticomyces elasticus]|nr:Phosphate metabolism transcription protein [Elasticomyces elasticus]
MRYGKTLSLAIYSPWREAYIDYAKLKHLLRDDDSNPASPSTENPSGAGGDKWTDEDESRFVDELVNVQLEKVHAFHKTTYETLRERTAVCEQLLDDVAVSEQQQQQAEGGAEEGSNGEGKKAVPSEDQKKKILTSVLSSLDQITQETAELEKYSRINYTGFLKAVKKHDRKRGGSYRIRPLLQVRLAALPFNTEDYSPLLYRLSAMYSFVRQNLEGAEKRGLSVSEQAGGQGVEGREEYVSHKFWVHPENLLEVKTMILRRLPVLIYNPVQTSLKTSDEGGSQQTQDPSMTSIYFDAPSFPLYSKKVDSGEASSLRLRWYGQLNEKPQIWIEKKTVREDGSSSDQRITTKEKYIQPFIKNEYHMEKAITKLSARTSETSPEVENLRTSVSDIQSLIESEGLQPVLRANYTRTAFQIPGDDRVRVSLDTDLAFIREDAIDSDRPCRDPDSWHRQDIDGNEMEYPFTGIRKGEINRFPFALLEVKLRRTGSGKRSEWIQDLMSSHLVKEAPRFSKFVHGVAVLFDDYVNTFPFWLPSVETDIRRDPQKAFEEEQERKDKVREDEFAVGSLLKGGKGSLLSPRMGGGGRLSRSGTRDVVSPVGSPAAAGGALSRSAGMNGKGKVADYGTVSDNQAHETAGEPDDDETGVQTMANGNAGMNTTSSGPGGLKGLVHHFSTSKYAASRRNKVKLPKGVEEPKNWIKDAGPVKVEAKVWLANQRTFIKWQHVSVLLATLSVGLFNAAGEHNTVARSLAVVYTLVAVATGVWGYGIYMWRCNLIEKRSGKDFDAVTGPIVVCVGLVVALVLNFAFKYRAIQHDKNTDAMMLGLGMGNSTEGLMATQW